MQTILITGINGFLGSNLAKWFYKDYKVIGTEYFVDNLYRIKDFGFKVYKSDLTNYEKLFNENKIDIVIHLATFYGRGNEEISQMLEANLVSPFHLLDFAIKNKCSLFINTDSALERYTSIYSLTKKQFLDWLKFRSNEIKAVNMQLEHFYGPGASPTNFISHMLDKLAKNEPEIDLTKGEQERDFIFYEDVITAYETIINSTDKLNEHYSHFEVGSGENLSIKDLMLLLKELTESNTKLNFGALPYRENELMHSKCDLKPIHQLGWRAKNNINQGIRKTIELIL